MKTKFFFAQVKKIDEQNRTIDAVASTIDLDRDHDIILPSAFAKSLASFKANPVILACHQHRLSSGSSPVIGSAIPESIKISQRMVTFKMTFAQTDLGEEYWLLYKDKHMRAFSIGFIPIEWEDKKDEKVGYIRTYTKIELLEISSVPVPSNRRALARAKGYFDDAPDDHADDNLKEITAKLGESITEIVKDQLDNFTIRIEDLFDEVKSLLIADSDGHAKELLGNPSEQSDPAGENKSEQVLETINQINDKL